MEEIGRAGKETCPLWACSRGHWVEKDGGGVMGGGCSWPVGVFALLFFLGWGCRLFGI